MYIVVSHTNALMLILLLCADKSCNSMDLNGLLSSQIWKETFQASGF